MATLAEQVQGERMARIALSMIAEPNDPTTGYVLTRHGGVETVLRRRTTGERTAVTVDAVVCATGFEPGGLTGLDGVAPPDATIRVARSHLAVIDGTAVPGLYVQGADLPGHGLGTTLLSNVAVRAGEIARALYQEESS